MDIEINKKVEIRVNGIPIIIADSFSMKLVEKWASAQDGDSTELFGPVLNIKGDLKEFKITADAELKRRKEANEHYDAFFKQMVKKVGDPNYHQPVR